MKNFGHYRIAYYFAFAFLLVYFLPFLLEWDNSIITLHDNLDSLFAYYRFLALEGKTLALDPLTPVESVLNGVPRMFIPSGFNYTAILCMIFPPYAAYILNFITVHLIAFFGMHLLLKRHFLEQDSDTYLVVFVSLAFALIPFYTIYGLSVAGIPLVLSSILNFRAGRQSRSDYIVLALFPLFSFFVFSGVFLIVLLGVWWLSICFKEKRVNRRMLTPIILLTAGYVVVDYQLFYNVIFPSDLVPHRIEFVLEKFSFETSLEEATKYFHNLQYHASNPPHIILASFVLALIIGITTRHRHTPLLIVLFLLNIAIAFCQFLYNWDSFAHFIDDVPIVAHFQWNRFYFLAPTIWYLKFGLSIKVISDGVSLVRFGRAFVFFIIAYQFVFLWRDNVEYRATSSNLLMERTGITFKAFYDEALFEEIEQYIGRPQESYRVASLGLHPAIPQYNGFYTADGYFNNYLLTYKRSFRSIIKKELAKNANLMKYFDEWGSRCYLFSSELGIDFLIPKDRSRSVSVDFDFDSGPSIDYVFSTVEIANAAANNIDLLNVFENEESIYRLYLYAVKASRNPQIIQELNAAVTVGLIGIAAELGLDSGILASLKGKYEILARKELLAQLQRFDVVALDGKAGGLRLLNEPGKIRPEELNIDLLTNYWEFNKVELVVAATTTLTTPPVLFEKGAYSMTITAYSSVAQGVTSHIEVLAGNDKVGEAFIPQQPGVIEFSFTIEKSERKPVYIRYTNDIRTESEDRNFWMTNFQLRRE